MAERLEYIDPILRGPINPQYIPILRELLADGGADALWLCRNRPDPTQKIDPKMHETAKIILKPPFMRLDSGAQMDSKLHIERVQSFSLRPSDKKPENSIL